MHAGPLALAPRRARHALTHFSTLGRMLVGRDAERRRLDGLVAGARLGRSGVLLITGEPGIGKTALLDHVRENANGLRLLRADGKETESDVPFGGLTQLLRPSERDLAHLPAPQSLALGVALALTQGHVVDRLAVGVAVLSLIVHYSEDAPVALVVDDAHLLDRPSAGALAFACRRLLADPVLVLLAARPNEPGPLTTAGLEELTLAGLDVSATTELARSRWPSVTVDDATVLHRVSGGNPLAVLELAETPALLPPAGHPAAPPVPLPRLLTERYAQQIRALGDDARAVLLLAALTEGDSRLVARAASSRGLSLAALAGAERARLVTVSAEHIAFAHPLVRAAVYTLAYPDQRRAFHAAVARALPVHDVDRRAWHLGEATIDADDAVAQALEDMGLRATSRSAYAVASTALARAAHLSTDDRDRARRLVLAGEAAWHGGDAEAAVDLANRATRLDPSPVCRGRALGLRGHVAARCSPAEARLLLAEAAEHLADIDASRAVMLLSDAVVACFHQADVPAALEVAEQLDRLRGRTNPTATAVGAIASGMAGVLAGRAGAEDVRAGMRRLEALEYQHPEDETIVPMWLVHGGLWLRETGQARTLVRAALEQSRSRSAVSMLPFLLLVRARDAATTDEWTAARANYGEGISLARELGNVTDLAMCLAGLAWLKARTGPLDECHAHAEEVREICSRSPIAVARVWAEYAVGEAALAVGQVEEAVTTLTRLTELLDEIDLRDPDLSPVPDLAEALVRTGRVAEARAVAERYDASARHKGMPWATARALRTALQLCDDNDLDGLASQALTKHALTPDVFEDARTRLTYGVRLRRARRRADARAPLREALTAFRRLGARAWAEAAAHELAATGETVALNDAPDRERLTARELQICLLLIEGRTTRETAAALFVSPKTVEYHLRRVYTKLDISSRDELRVHLGE